MNRILTGSILACAAVAFMFGDKAQAVNPYDAMSYGVQPAWVWGGNVNSKKSGARGNMVLDASGNVVIGTWTYGDWLWDPAVVPNGPGTTVNGSWQSAHAKIDTTGNVIWGAYTQDLIPAGGAGDQSYAYNPSIDPTTGDVVFTGSARHDIGTDANQIGNDQAVIIFDGTTGVVKNARFIGATHNGANPGDLREDGTGTVWDPMGGHAIHPTTGELFAVGYANGDLVAVGGKSQDPVGTPVNDYDPYLARFTNIYSNAPTLNGGVQPADGPAPGGESNDRMYGASMSPNGLYIAGTGWTQASGGSTTGTYGAYNGGSRDGIVGIYGTGAGTPLLYGFQSPVGGPDRDNVVTSAWTPTNQLIVGGYMGGQDGGQEHEGYLTSIDPTTGATNWTTMLGASEAGSVDYFINIDVAADGSIWTFGTTAGTLPGGAGTAAGSDMFVAKYDAAGNLLFTRNVGSPGGVNDAATGFTVLDETTMYLNTTSTDSTAWEDYTGNGVAAEAGKFSLTLLKYTLGDFNGDGKTNWDDQDVLANAIAGGPLAADTYDWDKDGDSDQADADWMVANLFDTVYGDHSINGKLDVTDADGITRPAFTGTFRDIADVDHDGDTDNDDVNKFLADAATQDGHATPYRRGDNDWNRKVDITDFNTLASAFDPGATNGNLNTWQLGDYNGDMKIDISDFNLLATNFTGGGTYDDAAAGVVADADPGQVDLIVDVETGEVTLDGNNAAISGLQVFSAGNSLLATDFTADVLQFVISTNTSTYAEGAFANMGVDGLISLGMMYDALVDARDVTFEYTMIGQPTVQGRVHYIPEPASLVLMGMGGLLVLRRRRAA